MYLSNGDIDPDYLLEQELDNEEYKEASEKLVDRAYRKITEWRMSVRDERPIQEADELAREAAETAYLIDRVNSNFVDNYGNLSDGELEAVNESNRAWRFVNESGTQMQYEGKDSEQFETGDFVLVNGNNVDPFAEQFEELETYTEPSEFIEKFSGPIRITSFSVDPEASLDDIDRDGVTQL